MECIGELKLLAELIEARGIAGMREVISNTAEFGAEAGGPRIVDAGVRDRMRGVLADIKSGEFARALGDEAAADYPKLRTARHRNRAAVLERTFVRLRNLSGS